MDSVEVEFVGGPMDGQRWSVPADPDSGRPADTVRVVVPADLFSGAARARDLLCELEVNPTDDGPLWWYRPRL